MRIHREWGSLRIELGSLWLIRCAPEHPNRWMVVWRRGLPERDPRAKWMGSEKPGSYWRGCDARLQRARGVDPEDALCRFPNCTCANISPEEKQEWERLRAERLAYRERWLAKLRVPGPDMAAPDGSNVDGPPRRLEPTP
ncbi:MAG: hypothetical protein C5B58_16345 [Acidobacteria bacterium]|nr:MAG: hypothetical protein C5B58_16345 [Acidobacteriota bacterium]